MKDCHDLCLKEDTDHQLGVREPDIIYAYGMCKMTVNKELVQYEKYHVLEFVEFLEFLARISTAKYRHITDAGVAQMTLAQKLEETLDDIFENYGIGPRNEVHVEIGEISESDDDY